MKENKKPRILICISAICVLAGLVLSLQSSNTAYALTHIRTLLIAAGAAGALYLCVVLLGSHLPEMVRDLALLIAVLATSFAMCTLIGGRTTLAGYIYFSDLEANNPVAISAMNIALGGIAAYLISLVLAIAAGFMRTKTEE